MREEALSDVPLRRESPPMDDETKLQTKGQNDANQREENQKNVAERPDDERDDDRTADQIAVQAVLRPPSYLPQPEAPPGLATSRSTGPEGFHPIQRSTSENSSAAAALDVASIGKYLRDRGNSFSAALAKRISSLREHEPELDSNPLPGHVTEFRLSGLKVVVRLKDGTNGGDLTDIKGRISFFSRSGCRDCGAVRAFLRERGLAYVEINVDVFPEREKELMERTGSAAVPQIFFNERLVGGLVALNSLRNSGELEKRLREMAGRRCPDSAPRVPVYGFDEDEEGKDEDRTDAMLGVVRVLRHRVPIQDRVSKMRLVKNCFAGSEMVEALIHHLDCARTKAVDIGKELARKHFIHHVFWDNDFEDANHQFYRFLEHDPIIPKCFNFRGSTNDDEPKLASAVGQRLTKLMIAVLEAYASDDRRHLDYARIGASEEFRRYVNLVQDLQRVDILVLSEGERLAFFLNLYNAMVIHAIIRIGRPKVIDRRSFFSDFHYIIGGYPYSMSTIKNGILRSNQRQPFSIAKPFTAGDKRTEVALTKVNPLIHFGLCNGTRSSPTVRFFSPQEVEIDLKQAAREFFFNGGMEVDLEKRTVYLTRIIKWYSVDFGHDKGILKWILCYLDASKAGLLTHLLNDGGPVTIAYQNFDWSLNS